MQDRARPLLLVVSAPSGAGKTTLCNRLVAERPDVVYSISCTTRRPRGGEQNGREYHFLSEADFAARVAAGAFLEHAVVHGNHYGTLRESVLRHLAGGRSVLMDIDVQGAAQIRGCINRPDCAPALRGAFVDIFIEPPSMEALRDRLQARNEDRADVIENRLRNAEAEMRQRDAYRYRIVNDDRDRAYRELEGILERERNKRQIQD